MMALTDNSVRAFFHFRNPFHQCERRLRTYVYLLRQLSLKLLKLSNRFLFVFSLVFVILSASIAYNLEPDTFESWFNALWWVMTTVVTVGYGDYFPVTVAGKIFAMFLYVFGIGLISLVIGKIIDAFVELKRRRESGRMSYLGKDHIILIGGSRKAKSAVAEILSTNPKQEIVLIAMAEKMPFEEKGIHFVSGDPSSEDILMQAGVKQARSAIVFADENIDDASLVDGKSLLIATSLERIAPTIHTTVEILMEKHIKNFSHVKVNDFILSHEAVSRLAVRSALSEGNSEIYTQLISRQYGDDLFEVAVKPDWRTYRDAFEDLLKQGATLVADRNDLGINRRLDELIPSDARLYVICDKGTYQLLLTR